MRYQPHDAFRQLYADYTGPGSIVARLTDRMAALTQDQPLLAVTGSDYILFHGGSRAPFMKSFRRTTRGFIELTSVSHLGPAVAWIFRLRELGDSTWRAEAEKLLRHVSAVR